MIILTYILNLVKLQPFKQTKTWRITRLAVNIINMSIKHLNVITIIGIIKLHQLDIHVTGSFDMYRSTNREVSM